MRKKIVIVGAGISGLSAARRLISQGVQDLLLLDLEAQAGGNAKSGQNACSAFPWGAHYVPIPNNDLKEYQQFLQEAGVITGYTAQGLPIFNELQLCFDPEERLYINGHWQDGLVPQYGLPPADLDQVKRFLQAMDQFREVKGKDGRFAFTIPIAQTSQDAAYTSLDELTMQDWMQQQGYVSQYLVDYVNYCMRDDYGTPANQTSAWAGIQYYACRKGKGENAVHSDVLTWPEGNGFLVKQLLSVVNDKIRLNTLVTRVRDTGAGVELACLNAQTREAFTIIADQCILAIPQFVAARLLGDPARQELVAAAMHYSPWMVANILCNELSERKGAPLSWDNVIHGGYSLGYVDATHQFVQQKIPKKNLTYYLPLTASDPVTERKQALARTHEDWTALILTDLEKVHPDIREKTEAINIMLWGHAMIQPRPGFIHGTAKKQLAASLNGRIHFAHTDLAGISIFEEAFYQGLHAADTVMEQQRRV